MASNARSFAGDTLHSTTISEECEGMVVDHFETGLVELGSCVNLCNGKTNCVRKSLAEGASSDLDAICVMSLGVTRSDAVNGLYEHPGQ